MRCVYTPRGSCSSRTCRQGGVCVCLCGWVGGVGRGGGGVGSGEVEVGGVWCDGV